MKYILANYLFITLQQKLSSRFSNIDISLAPFPNLGDPLKYRKTCNYKMETLHDSSKDKLPTNRPTNIHWLAFCRLAKRLNLSRNQILIWKCPSHLSGKNARCKLQDSNCKIQIARFKLQDTSFKIYVAWSIFEDVSWKMQVKRFKLKDASWKM